MRIMLSNSNQITLTLICVDLIKLFISIVVRELCKVELLFGLMFNFSSFLTGIGRIHDFVGKQEPLSWNSIILAFGAFAR